MKITTRSMFGAGALLAAVMMTGITVAQPSVDSLTVESKGQERAFPQDVEILFELVQQSRTELQALRAQAGLDNKGREGRGEHGGGEGRESRERGEGRGEHGGREGREEHGGRAGGGEEGNVRVRKNETWKGVRNGAHLAIAYNPNTQSFQGTVRNTTSDTLPDVRVEVHLSNGAELGPTQRINLAPGQSASVELSAAHQRFTWWTTHPESGVEEEHGEEGGHEEGGEEKGNRPADAALRPLYNELLLLKHEIQSFRRDARASRRRRG